MKDQFIFALRAFSEVSKKHSGGPGDNVCPPLTEILYTPLTVHVFVCFFGLCKTYAVPECTSHNFLDTIVIYQGSRNGKDSR